MKKQKDNNIMKGKITSTADLKKLDQKVRKVDMMMNANEAQQKNSIRSLCNLNDLILQQSLSEKDIRCSLKLVHQIQENISKIQYSQKGLFHTHMSIYYHNLAYILNELTEDTQCCKAMEKAVYHYQLVYQHLTNKEQQIAHLTHYVQVSMQYCAVLSHNYKHLEAVAVAEQSLLQISLALKILNQICCHQVNSTRQTMETTLTESQSRIRSERVNFKKVVIKEAEKLLSSLEELPSSQQLISDQKEQFEQKIKNMYFWKNNSDNNTKSMCKELIKKESSSSERNLLGLQKTSNFNEQFSLSELMSLNIRKMQPKLNTDTYYLLSSAKIMELALMGSVCYFTMATETRFSEGNLDVAALKINQKYKKLYADQTILHCKVLHLKAIELAAQFLPHHHDFFCHLINSFNKNYKCVMDSIQEESEISIQSINHNHNQNQNNHNQNQNHNNHNSNQNHIYPSDLPHSHDDYAIGIQSTHKPKKKRSVSKDKFIAITIKKKTRAISANKKVI